jgi:hypothetical protein
MHNFNTKNTDLRYPLGVIYCLGALFSLSLVLFLVLRRNRLALRSRCFPLVLLSCLGNLGGMTCMAYDGMTVGGSDEREWMIFSLTLFFEYVFFGPYLLRMYHLKVSYFDFMKDEQLYWRRAKQLRVSWYFKVLFLGLIPYAFLPIILGICFWTHLFTHKDSFTGEL